MSEEDMDIEEYGEEDIAVGDYVVSVANNSVPVTVWGCGKTGAFGVFPIHEAARDAIKKDMRVWETVRDVWFVDTQGAISRYHMDW